MDSPALTPRPSQRNKKSPLQASSISSPTSGNMPTLKTMSAHTARRSPILPTTLETFLLSIYPTILVLGSIFAILDPSARNAPYNAQTQSHHAATAPSYFAKKSNVFNQFFVKIGWAWITLSYFLFLFTHPSTGPPLTFVITPKRIRGTLRYGIVTLWWIFVTQWFFGPAIIDRGFVATGGQCELVRKEGADMDEVRRFVTSVACKSVGGSWKGGHDISGHVFLLVLGSMFIFEEILHVVLKTQMTKEQRTVSMADGAVKSAEVEATLGGYDSTVERPRQWTIGARVGVGVGALSVYMLLMTAAYFHTWFEKLTGLLVALSGIFVVYFLPRAIPALRSVIGMPGV
ncbi:hypothetical protein HYALB_00000046 [Hymenoscyphus albidus]|uniref:Acyl-coenzyme A diphosphatase SCS3 n=1 Tax=Hymenoscyphus albidus TaxID=595503 RepID=A0A9N9LFV9_9HELO|nr:hypothetical protein HYALB_00000046 [Hymenoscyphus albidus]